mmetsp:Transcript_98855/g.247872  ORF Transcript_98855/g.247872 Transcript_98855/m.247872 type:complete len:379 (-) Transcript_98855:247-1383(-)
MPPKKAATKYAVRLRAEGKWFILGTGQEASSSAEGGVLRVRVDTDLAKVVIHVGPDYLEEWNPAPLGAHSVRYLRGGSHVHISFEMLAPVYWRGDVQLSAQGLAGRFGVLGEDDRQHRTTGTVEIEEERDYAFELPRPSAGVVERLRIDPPRIAWEAPECCVEDGAVWFVGIGGASRSGKTSLAAALAKQLQQRGHETVVVGQRDYERSIGSYRCSVGVDEAMYDHPAAIDWRELSRVLSQAIEDLAGKTTLEAPAIVIFEGTFALWPQSICKFMRRRILLRASRSEILRRRQSSDPLAEPFVEHVFWPMHLQYGLPQAAPWEELQIEDGSAAYPVPEELLAEALGILGLGATSKAAEASEGALPAAPQAESAAAAGA